MTPILTSIGLRGLAVAIGRPSGFFGGTFAKGLISYFHAWIPDDLPQMTIRVLEITGVASPKCIVGSFDDLCTCSFRLLHHHVNFFFAADIMTDGKLGRAMRGFGEVRVMSNILARPNGKHQSWL